MNKGLMVALAVAVISQSVISAQVEFSYSKLFSQLKHNVSETHPDVKVGYFMISPLTGEVCKITRAWMTRKKHYEELQVPVSQELLLPIDSHLRRVNPDVFIQTAGIDICDVSFQVMAKATFEKELPADVVQTLVPQMTAMMKDLGGMFASWYMPDIEGVMVHFDESVSSLTTSKGRVIAVNGNVAVVSLAELEEDERIYFDVSPLKITPWIPQS